MRNRIVPPHVPDHLKGEIRRNVAPIKREERGRGVCLYVPVGMGSVAGIL